MENDKFTPHTQAEMDWVTEMHELNNYFINNGLTFQKGIRLGRQAKCFGSTGVHRIHIYMYRNDEFELWINGYHKEYNDIISKEAVIAFVVETVKKRRESKRRDKWTRSFKALISNCKF